MTINDTSGQAHPYWYEWFVGLIEVVNLLNPDHDIESVAFQVASIKVWDDVVVHLKNGQRCYQVKHSRAGKSLTFGSLVQADSDGYTLLGGLFKGWQESGLDDGQTKLILYTNRAAGNRWAALENGNRRPPLVEFWSWLQTQINGAHSLSLVTIPDEYKDGWREWMDCLDNSDGSKDIAFLRQLEIRTEEDDLDDLENRIRQSLATAFGVSLEKAAPLFDALNRELRRWTTGHPGVTVETLYTALTVPPESKELAHAPPPPTPFFPTRCPVAEELERVLLSDEEHPVIFLSGEPGSGKTSVVSWLANRRTESAFQGVIGIRFFCFEPIRPEQPFIAPDSSRVQPEELWFSLLAQLRRGLEGRLHELKVPLRNTLLEWHDARAHVIRLADLLGQQLGRKFVISIDGIDHAARSSQVHPESIASFFASIPTADELCKTSIRLLIAGQPPEYYANQYPAWLQGEHPKVRRIDLPKLESADIYTLFVASRSRIPATQFHEGVRLVEAMAKGNTLAVVFAVAESESTDSLDALKTRLEQRHLSDGVTAYYDSIWQHALRTTPDLSCTMAGTVSLARRPLTAEQLEKAFPDWGKPNASWQSILEDLGPLLVSGADGFRIRHNDVRVFLASRFQGFGGDKTKAVASRLANYFRSKDCDRLAAHLQLFGLLALADREKEHADVYDIDWVIEGSVLGIEFAQLRDEGDHAGTSLSAAGKWSNVVSVACALQTLARLGEDADVYPELEPPRNGELPPFLPSEASVRPFSHWTREDFDRLISDALELMSGGAKVRAIGLLDRWLSGLTLNEIVLSLPDMRSTLRGLNDKGREGLDRMASGEVESLGSLCGSLGFPISFQKKSDTSRVELDALAAFENGFVRAVTTESTAVSVEQLFAVHRPLLRSSWEMAVRLLASSEQWTLVGQLLSEMNRKKLSSPFLAEATWFALRSSVSTSAPDWLNPLAEKDYGLTATEQHISYHEANIYESHLNVCRALGWTRLGFDTAEIADSVLQVFAPYDEFKNRLEFQLIFHASALLGRIVGLANEKGWENAAEAASDAHIQQVLSALWSRSWHSGLYNQAAKIGEELASCCIDLGAPFEQAAFNAALPLAEQWVLGPRMKAIWDIVKRRGRIDVLRQWTEHYLSTTSDTWNSPSPEAREIVGELVPFALSIGQNDLATYASQRANWLRIAYRDRKEYSFEEVHRWFQKSAEIDPTTWSTRGWQLWQLCSRCKDQGRDNEFELDILNSISAAAIRRGASEWWQLISTTLVQANKRDWHFHARERLVEGARIALEQGAHIVDNDILPLWSLALSLSYWFRDGESVSLRDLAKSLVSAASEGRKAEFDEILERSVPPVILHSPADGGPENSEGAASGLARVETRDDVEFWSAVDSIVADALQEEKRWSFHDGLLRVARDRAFLHGNDVLLEGLDIQLQMHSRWTHGAGELNQATWKVLPKENVGATWEWIGIQFQKILLESYSAEVIGAALRGMHSLVAQNPRIIRRLFDTIRDEWAQRWLLNAAEAWAVLHAKEVAEIQEDLRQALVHGDLDSRLQAWVVLARNRDALRQERIPFPVPEEPVLDAEDESLENTPLLEVPPIVQGHAIWANRYSAAQSMLKYCEIFGFDFSTLEGLVANYLYESREENDLSLKERGPHRYGDYFCSPLDAEKAVGHAILQVLSNDWFSQEAAADLCHAFLANEDSWVYRAPPQPVCSSSEWPSEGEYGGTDIDVPTRHERMLNAATTASLPKGWRVFSARVVDHTWKDDFVLDYWFEAANDTLLINRLHKPTCPGGRSFVWWVGRPFELPRRRFVSGLFVGGRTRLFHCHFEIRPPKAWRDSFGWEPNQSNPLEWISGGQVIAKYERLHGMLRDNPHGPNYRQPLIDRWLITDDAFKRVQSILGDLQSRHAFETASFKSD